MGDDLAAPSNVDTSCVLDQRATTDAAADVAATNKSDPSNAAASVSEDTRMDDGISTTPPQEVVVCLPINSESKNHSATEENATRSTSPLAASRETDAIPLSALSLNSFETAWSNIITKENVQQQDQIADAAVPHDEDWRIQYTTRDQFSHAITNNKIKIQSDTSVTGQYMPKENGRPKPVGCELSTDQACRDGIYDVIIPTMRQYENGSFLSSLNSHQTSQAYLNMVQDQLSRTKHNYRGPSPIQNRPFGLSTSAGTRAALLNLMKNDSPHSSVGLNPRTLPSEESYLERARNFGVSMTSTIRKNSRRADSEPIIQNEPISVKSNGYNERTPSPQSPPLEYNHAYNKLFIGNQEEDILDNHPIPIKKKKKRRKAPRHIQQMLPNKERIRSIGKRSIAERNNSEEEGESSDRKSVVSHSDFSSREIDLDSDEDYRQKDKDIDIETQEDTFSPRRRKLAPTKKNGEVYTNSRYKTRRMGNHNDTSSDVEMEDDGIEEGAPLRRSRRRMQAHAI
jgi:hypothetical protein